MELPSLPTISSHLMFQLILYFLGHMDYYEGPGLLYCEKEMMRP